MISVKILLRKVATKNGSYPIIMRVIKDRKTKTLNLGIYTKLEQWNEKANKFKSNYPNYREANLVLLKHQERAEKIIYDFEIENSDFSLAQFEEIFRGVKTIHSTVSEFWKNKIDNLLKVGRIGTAKTNQSTYNSFFKFSNKKSLIFKDLNPMLLQDYEIFLREHNNTDGGIIVKMKDLRSLYNEAIKNKIVDPKHYPFKIYQISKLKGGNIKKALSRTSILRIQNADISEHPHLLDAKNYFIFSYYTRGMNWQDMLTLTWDHIHSNRIYYRRAKTKGLLSMRIEKPIQEILDYYKSFQSQTKYVFPILLRDNMNPLQIYYRKARTLKKFNKQLKELAKLVGVTEVVTSYTIRHSFATNMKQAGVSTDIISQALGHNNIEITQAYLKDFENEIIDDAMRKLEEPSVRYAS